MKQCMIVFLLFYVAIHPVYSEYFQYTKGEWDWLKPHINVGTLVEVDYEDTVKNIIKTEPLSGRHIKGYTLDIEYFVPERAYKQYDEKSGTTFYRLMFRYINMDPYSLDRTVNSYQMIYFVEEGHSANLIFADFYHTTQSQAFDFYDGVTNMMPIIRQNKLAGIMKYHYSEYEIISISEEVEHESRIDHIAEIYWINDIKTVDIDSLYMNIRMEVSPPLLDKTDIFKYTIQNAFDGNPATSYVEDTENNLFEINVDFFTDINGNFNFNAGTMFTDMNITRIAVINGYAANEGLYYANNSVMESCFYYSKIISDSERKPEQWKITFDKTLDYQIIHFDNPIPGFLLVVTEIIKGLKYNDTCIAELNFEVKGTGWLFGGDL